ncbi:PqqD family peptide modification chaperone [Agromyces sp. MMS24-JH15]|uniref:PqqD family peptide modification chaperone n=1 Tax=Agromyces sp. MMS24-JH15 TaxID=3243765 RepID=UPI0037491A83
MTIDPDTVIRPSPSLAIVDSGGRIVLLDLDRFREPEVIALEGTGRDLLLAVPAEGATVREVAMVLAESFGAALEVVEADVVAVVGELVDRGVVATVPASVG